MAGGKHHHRVRAWQGGIVFKGALLGADERSEALRLKALRFSAVEIARALGRRVPDIAEFLNSPEAQL